jgi:polyhydroxybutyrate depolymerase
MTDFERRRPFPTTGLLLAGWLLSGCVAPPPPPAQAPAPAPGSPAPAPAPPVPAPASAPAPAPKRPYRLALCTEAPIRLPSAPGAPQSRGCVATFTQALSDPATIRRLGATEVQRRTLVYAPERLPAAPVPVVFMFPGYTASAEAAAFYYTHGSFERLADRDGFVVVYGNGLPNPPPSGEKPTMPAGGFLQGCLADHAGEGVDVTYVRRILDLLATEISIDRTRVYAAGLSAGGGMAFQLALEAPDLVAAVAPVAALPFQPAGVWRHFCHPRPGHERVSIAMLAATGDRFISYAPGGSPEYPNGGYPGMEETRDAWLAALRIRGAPTVDRFPDAVQGDSHTPHTGRTTSTIERHRYPPGPDGQELWYYKAEGMGHWWPHPLPMWPGLWGRFGKANQDIDFAEEAWAFFQRHRRPSR